MYESASNLKADRMIDKREFRHAQFVSACSRGNHEEGFEQFSQWSSGLTYDVNSCDFVVYKIGNYPDQVSLIEDACLVVSTDIHSPDSESLIVEQISFRLHLWGNKSSFKWE